MTTSCLAKKIIIKQNSKILFIDNAYRPSTCKTNMPTLYYNFFRYYEPDMGRFVNQEKIMLWIKQLDVVKDMMIHKEQDMESTRI